MIVFEVLHSNTLRFHHLRSTSVVIEFRSLAPFESQNSIYHDLNKTTCWTLPFSLHRHVIICKKDSGYFSLILIVLYITIAMWLFLLATVVLMHIFQDKMYLKHYLIKMKKVTENCRTCFFSVSDIWFWYLNLFSVAICMSEVKTPQASAGLRFLWLEVKLTTSSMSPSLPWYFCQVVSGLVLNMCSDEEPTIS